MIGAKTKPKATETTIVNTPGKKNGWLNTYFPMRLVPVSSICTAPNNVGYVGNTNKAETAANEATIIGTEAVFSGVMPKATITVGIKAWVVAACEYKSILAKNKATANKNG